MPTSGIAGSYGNSVFSFLRNLHTEASILNTEKTSWPYLIPCSFHPTQSTNLYQWPSSFSEWSCQPCTFVAGAREGSECFGIKEALRIYAFPLATRCRAPHLPTEPSPHLCRQASFSSAVAGLLPCDRGPRGMATVTSKCTVTKPSNLGRKTEDLEFRRLRTTEKTLLLCLGSLALSLNQSLQPGKWGRAIY